MILVEPKKRPLHKSLLRVLKKESLGLDNLPTTKEQWQNFINKIDQILIANDEDRYLLERSLELTSLEMQDLINESQEKYRQRINALLKVIPDMIFYLDEQGKYVDLISCGTEEYPCDNSDKKEGKHISEVFPKTYAKEIEKANSKALEKNILTTIEYETKVDGVIKFFEVRILPTPLKENNLKTSVIIIRDITLQKKSIFYHQVMSRVFQEAQEGIFILSLDGEYIGHNRAFSKIFGFDEEEVPPLDIHFYSKFFSKEDYKKIKESMRKYGSFKGESTIRKDNGEEVLALISIDTIKPSDRISGYILAIITDISELQKSREELYYIATHDALTGLPNRKFTLENINRSIKKLSRDQKRGALIFIDLDDFKLINDLLGHKAGDEVLCEVTKRIESRIRASDLFGRLGGDEFVLFLEDIEGVDDISSLAQNIIDILTFPFDIGGSKHRIGASLGIAIFPDDARESETLLQHADRAMYEAKECGKNRYSFYSKSLKHSIKEFKRVKRILKRAMKHKGMCLFYQPQFEIQTGKIVGIEALVRIDKKVGGGIGPNDFIPVAKESGLIVALSKWILEETCKQISKLQNLYGMNDIYVSINVSDRQVMDEKWADEVAFFIKKYNINPNLLEFELTEDILIQSRQSGFKTLKKLRALGCRLAIDDFGTGLMSLNSLEPEMIHRVKIDQSFIAKLDKKDENARRLIKASILLAHSMGVITVAEGVEKQAQKDELISLECDQAQGYLLASPLNNKDVLKFILKSSIDQAS
jgi:diguanylate cyclase (GGDEF)-like protein/PAS domain S-box-containing protein